MEFPPTDSWQARNSKIAIPRLDQSQREQPPSNKSTAAKVRTSRACHNCRKRKVKCTGGTPCRSCEEQALDCVYNQGRRDRLKDATDHNVLLSSVLRELSIGGTLAPEDQQRVDELLDSVADEVETTAKSFGKRPARDDARRSSHSGEFHATGSVGSNEDAYHIDEDLLETHEARATGLIGQNSEIQWLHKLKRQSSGSANSPIADSTFYLDGDDLELDVAVNAEAMPLPETAERLFSAYMTAIHDAFPILPKVFETQFYNYIQASKQHQHYNLPYNVQAILNLVMAIGARYSHLTHASWREDDRDHLIYMNRAIKLLEGKSNMSIIVSAPDLSLIQATGLLSLYYAVIGHVNRAWVIIGISIRYAFAVGLHLQNDDPTASPEKKDALMRVWWSLHSIECLLSSMTGRPCVISNEHCSVRLPDPRPGELGPASSTAFDPDRKTVTRAEIQTAPGWQPYSSFFEARIRIGLIMQKAQALLYSPRVNVNSWDHIQKSILSLTNELNRWAKSTFPNGAIRHQTFKNQGNNPEMFREQYTLLFYYYSTEIIISRPCLCRLDDRIEGQSSQSDDFNQRMGEFCVRSAGDIVQLLPDKPDTAWIYHFGPWWSLLHNLMQAATVFLLELSNQETHSKKAEISISESLKKLVIWLRAMRKDNDVANKAYNIMLGMIRSCKPRRQQELLGLFDDNNEKRDRFLREPSQKFSPQLLDPNSWQMQQSIMFANRLADDSLDTSPTFGRAPDPSDTFGGSFMDHTFAPPSHLAHTGGLDWTEDLEFQEFGQFVDDGIPTQLNQQQSTQPHDSNLDPSWASTYYPLLVPNFDDNMDESWGTSFDQPSAENLAGYRQTQGHDSSRSRQERH